MTTKIVWERRIKRTGCTIYVIRSSISEPECSFRVKLFNSYAGGIFGSLDGAKALANFIADGMEKPSEKKIKGKFQF